MNEETGYMDADLTLPSQQASIIKLLLAASISENVMKVLLETTWIRNSFMLHALITVMYNDWKSYGKYNKGNEKKKP